MGRKIIATLAAFLGVTAAATGVVGYRMETDDAFVMEEEETSAPVMHIGVTNRTIGQIIPIPGLYEDAAANIQYSIRDSKDKDKDLSFTFRVADDDLSSVVVYDGLKKVYSTSLDDIVGTVYGDVRYDEEHSGFHMFRVVAQDASGNTTRSMFVMKGRNILFGVYPGDEQPPLVFFADKDDAWYDYFEGEGYKGKAQISDKTPYIIDGFEPMSGRPPMYGFSSRVFDEDLAQIELYFNDNLVWDKEFTKRKVDGRTVKNPSEVHLMYGVPKFGDTYEITVRATDSQGNVTEESRTVTAPTE